MTSNRYSEEVQGAIDRLNAGGRLLVIEEHPYPAPHQVVVILADEHYSLSYNDFVFLLTQKIIQPVGSTVFGRFPAEEYMISGDFQE